MIYSQFYNYLSHRLGSDLTNNPEILKGIISDHKPIFELCADKNFKERFLHIESSAEKLGASRADVIVVGSGNHGKSTLVNALVGQDVARTSFLPNTWCIHRYAEGSAVTATVKYRCGKESQCSHEEAKKIWDSEEKKAVADRSYSSDVFEIDWESPEFHKLGKFNIVDTPGLNQQRQSVHDNVDLEDYYFKAGLVLWVIRADKINEKATIEAIERVRRYNKKVIVVITRWDKVVDKETVFLEAIQFYKQNVIVPVSALQEVKNPSTLDSNISTLRGEMLKFIQNEFVQKFTFSLYDEFKLNLNEAVSYLKEEKKRIKNNKTVYMGKIKSVDEFIDSFLGHQIDIPSITEDKVYGFMYSQVNKINHKNAESILGMIFHDDYLKKKSRVLEFTVNSSFRKITSKLASNIKSQKYQINQYDYEGNVELSESIDEEICENSIHVKIQKPNLELSSSLSTFLYKNLPNVLLELLDIFFPEHRQNKVDEFKSEIRSKISNHKNNLDQSIECDIKRAVDENTIFLKNVIDAYFKDSIAKNNDDQILEMKQELFSNSEAFVLKRCILQ